MRKILGFGLGAVMLAQPLYADSDALIIGNAEGGFMSRSVDLSGFARQMRGLGLSVTAVRNADGGDMERAFARFLDGIDQGTDQVAVVLAGSFAHTVGGAYLLPAGSDVETAFILNNAFPLDAAFAVLAEFPGQAVLVLGDTDEASLQGPFIQNGPGTLDIPQGVTVIRGEATRVLRFMQEARMGSGRDLISAAENAGMTVEGFVPRELVFAPPRLDPVPVEPLPPIIDFVADQAAWQAAVRANTEEAYVAYIEENPRGHFIREARQRLTAIRSEPLYREKKIEAALNLTREARRDIQRDLSLLGYNTRGIDGIFGRGSRGAIAAWQKDNGHPSNGYLTGEQVARLDGQAERRAAEFEEEARQRQEEQERRDRAFWEETGAKGDVAGLRAYLDRYPDGVFSEQAQEQLDAIERERQGQAEARDRNAWRTARQVDTIESYREYLRRVPDGVFVEEAHARIDYLERHSEQNEDIARAKAEEESLRLNSAARRLAEGRLAQLGLRPGAIDGTFDEDTRRAIRRYQDARRLKVTGYLDQATVVRLMADSITR